MKVMFLLIAASLLFATGFLLAFLWAVKSGQFEDKYTPSVRILFEESKPRMQQRKVIDDKGTILDEAEEAGASRFFHSTPAVRDRTRRNN